MDQPDLLSRASAQESAVTPDGSNEPNEPHDAPGAPGALDAPGAEAAPVASASSAETADGSDPSQLESALAALQRIVGQVFVRSDRTSIDRYARHVGDAGTRPIAIVMPGSTEQVQQVVAVARRTGLALYPISRGCNWGYGCATAPTDRQIILDLSRMNRIVQVDRELGFAVIEAGVSQGQLAGHLQQHAPELWVDCTGAGLSASLVGNTLDHGFGHTRLGDHFASTCGMKVVLGTGQIVDTGLGHFPNARASHVYPYGVGPMIDGLFCQSNFGIVTQITIWLQPKPQAMNAFFFAAPHEADLVRIVDALRKLRMAGMLQTAIHIANDLRTFSSRQRYPYGDIARAAGDSSGGAGQIEPLGAEQRARLQKQHGIGAWNGCGAIYGSPASVRAARRALKQAMPQLTLKFIDDRKLDLAKAVIGRLNRVGIARNLGKQLAILEPLYRLFQGQPGDEHLAGIGWRLREPISPAGVQATDPRDSSAGLKWISPVLPATGQDARALMQLIEPIYNRHGFDALVTMTMITERAMIAVTNVAYDRSDPRQCERAAQCYDELYAAVLERGFVPYRTGPHGYDKLRAHGGTFWQTAGQLKTVLDPDGIISPGRYVRAVDDEAA